MNDVKFIDFKKTPDEKKRLGIATVLINGVIFLRYSVNSGDKGGYFVSEPSYKVTEGGEDIYLKGFLIESTMLKETIENLIRSNVKKLITPQNSVFNNQEAAQNNSNEKKTGTFDDSEIPF